MFRNRLLNAIDPIFMLFLILRPTKRKKKEQQSSTLRITALNTGFPSLDDTIILLKFRAYSKKMIMNYQFFLMSNGRQTNRRAKLIGGGHPQSWTPAAPETGQRFAILNTQQRCFEVKVVLVGGLRTTETLPPYIS